MILSAAPWFRCVLVGTGLFAWMSIALPRANAADPFRERIVPFVKTYCVQCHNADLSEAALNLAGYKSVEAAAADFRQWEHVITFLEREEMPPKTAEKQPKPAERAAMIQTIRSVFRDEARKFAGDPGVVLPRRLSNAEYDHTIRDLTGIDIHPTRSFPVDPAAGEGFNNTGEALTMSPALFAKLYAAAQHVADHGLLTTRGLTFAPYPVSTYADRAKYYEQAILQFYNQHNVDYESYLTACWEFQHQPRRQPAVTLEDFARSRSLSSGYLAKIDQQLQAVPEPHRVYQIWLKQRWQAVPAPTDPDAPQISAETRAALQRLAREIPAVSRQLCPREAEAIVANAGNAPIDHLARRRKTSGERDAFDPQAIRPVRRLAQEFRGLDREPAVRIVLATAHCTADAKDTGYVILKSLNFSTAPENNYQPNDEKRNFPLRKLLADHAPEQLDRLKFGVHPSGDAIDAEACVVAVPGTLEFEVPVKAFSGVKEIRFFADAELDRAGTKSGAITVSLNSQSDAAPNVLADPEHSVARDIAESGKEFCRVFPNRFFFADETRGLSSGFHLIEGFFRDDQPLYGLVLNDEERRELDRLWTELEFVTGITEKMLRGFVFFERSERNFLKHADFDPFKEEDSKLVDTEMLQRFERVYLDRSNVKQPMEELTNHPIHIFFDQIRDGLRRRRQQMRDAEPACLQNVENFAQAAYRRPLTAKERDDLRGFFHEIAGNDQQGLEQAVHASLVRILVSPYFCCRVNSPPDGQTVEPLSGLDLASRLSYFVWASAPDAELLSLAAEGRLQDEQVLLEQSRRMLRDEKVSGFAREFFGQWLGYRDFLQQESIDRNLFKDFDEELKQALFEEPTRFASHLIRSDAPITRLLDSDQTFVNPRLARHYDLPFAGRPGDWVSVDGLKGQGRSGILGMGVFLAKNSQPQRTSPVKRGFWAVHKVLGEHIPAPPADVVALPAKETETNGKTIRELLALHVEDAKCARCHQRFDAVGLSMEGFDAIGRRRTKDLAGRPVDDAVLLPDGTQARGVPEFARHLVEARREDFVRTLCRKLLGYALGRSLQLSDDVLLDEMRVALDTQGDRFVPLLETVIRSPQFRNQRCRDFSPARFRPQTSGDDR